MFSIFWTFKISFDTCHIYINTNSPVYILLTNFGWALCINNLLKTTLEILVWNTLQCCINVKHLHGHKINIIFIRLTLQYPHFEAQNVGRFWMVCDLKVGHKTYMFNEKNNADKKFKNKLLGFMNSPFQLWEVVCSMTSALHIHSIPTIPISCVKCVELNSIEM